MSHAERHKLPDSIIKQVVEGIVCGKYIKKVHQMIFTQKGRDFLKDDLTLRWQHLREIAAEANLGGIAIRLGIEFAAACLPVAAESIAFCIGGGPLCSSLMFFLRSVPAAVKQLFFPNKLVTCFTAPALLIGVAPEAIGFTTRSIIDKIHILRRERQLDYLKKDDEEFLTIEEKELLKNDQEIVKSSKVIEECLAKDVILSHFVCNICIFEVPLVPFRLNRYTLNSPNLAVYHRKCIAESWLRSNKDPRTGEEVTPSDYIFDLEIF